MLISYVLVLHGSIKLMYLFSYKNFQVLLTSVFPMHFIIKSKLSDESSLTHSINDIELVRQIIVLTLKNLSIQDYLLKYNDKMSEIEIIPTTGSFLEQNVLDKVEKHKYIFWQEHCNKKSSMEKEDIIKIYHAYNSAIKMTLKIQPYKFYNEKITYTNINKLAQILINRFPELFNTEKFIIPDSACVVTPKCPFDDPEVIYKQLVLETKCFNLLTNIAPYSEYHFLITPKIAINNNDVTYKHDYRIESWEFLTTEQRIEAYKLCLEVSMILAYCSKQKTISFIHNGISAGQTVAHTHLHILTIPNKEKYLYKISNDLINFCRQKDKDNIEEKADYINFLKNKVGSILYQHRMANRSPVTFHLDVKQKNKQLKQTYKKIKLIN